MDSYLDSNYLFVIKTESPHLVLVGLTAGKLAGELGLDFEIYKIFFRLNYLDFYFVDISAMLLVVLKVFSRVLLNKVYFKVCFVVQKKLVVIIFISFSTIRS